MKQIFNPYLPLNEYIPDGEPHVFGDRLYVFGSHDKANSDTFCELDYVSWSAPVNDLSNWRCDGVIYSGLQDPHSEEELEGYGKRRYLYAPDVVQGADGRYYLYYCLSAYQGHGGFDGPISVAVCDTPNGRYEYYGDVKTPDGKPLSRYIPFDPGVLRDGDRFYLYYGWAFEFKPTINPLKNEKYCREMCATFHKSMQEVKHEAEGIMGANVVELENDMLTVKGEPVRIVPCELAAKGTGFENHAFFEASSMRRVGDKYYFIYSSSVNHELCYAVSDRPDGGFKYGGVIISNGDIGYKGRRPKNRLAASGNNHGSIVCVNGQWYIFYHRHTNLTTYSRQGCAEKISIAPDGSIAQVEMTSCGLNNGALIPAGTYPASIACNITDGRMPHTTNGINNLRKPHITQEEAQQYVSTVTNGTVLRYKYFAFNGGRKTVSVTLRGAGIGKLLIRAGRKKAVIPVDISSEEWYPLSAKLRLPKETAALEIKYKGSGSVDIVEFSFT